jgi:hypothetical protein
VAEISFASLSPTLLARKGGAKPAMRPQHAALASMPNTASEDHAEPEALEDLGWNDMGEGEQGTAEVFHLTPMARTVEPEALSHTESPAHRPAVLDQQHEIAERLTAPQHAKRRPVRERASRAAFTLRLDADRHLKLRLATTIRGVSAQALVTDALDALLGAMPELDTLAAQVKRR